MKEMSRERLKYEMPELGVVWKTLTCKRLQLLIFIK